MPASFSPDGYGELWVPSSWGVPANVLRPNVDPRPVRDSQYLSVWGRLKPGVSLEKARAEMTAIMTRLEQQYPVENRDAGIAVVPLHEELVSDIRPILFVLLAAVGLFAPDRLRECRQSATRARCGACARSLDSRCAWREPLANHPPTADREHHARADWRSARCPARHLGHSAPALACAANHERLSRYQPQSRSARVQRRRYPFLPACSSGWSRRSMPPRQIRTPRSAKANAAAHQRAVAVVPCSSRRKLRSRSFS